MIQVGRQKSRKHTKYAPKGLLRKSPNSLPPRCGGSASPSRNSRIARPASSSRKTLPIR